MPLGHLLSPLLLPDALGPLRHGTHLLGEGGGRAPQLTGAGDRCPFAAAATSSPFDQRALGALLLPGGGLEAVRFGCDVTVSVMLRLGK
jgi:hypothetical protein